MKMYFSSFVNGKMLYKSYMPENLHKSALDVDII